MIGVDYSFPILRRARELQSDEGIQLLNAEAYHLPLSSESVDAVVCVGVLQTLTYEKKALREIHRILKPGGVLFLDGINGLGLNELIRWKPVDRLRTHNPFILRKYLEQDGFQTLKIVGTYILPSFFLSLEHHLESKKVFQKMDDLLSLFIFFARAFILIGVKK